MLLLRLRPANDPRRHGVVSRPGRHLPLRAWHLRSVRECARRSDLAWLAEAGYRAAIVEDIITGLSRILRLFEPRWRTRCAGLDYPKDDRYPPSRCDPRRRRWADCLFWVEAV